MRNIIPQNIPYPSIIAHITKKVNPFAVFLYIFILFLNKKLPGYFWSRIVAERHLREGSKLPSPSIRTAFNSFEPFSLKNVRFLAEQGQFWEFFV